MWLKFVRSCSSKCRKNQVSQSGNVKWARDRERERDDFVRNDADTYKTRAWYCWFACSYFRPSLAFSFLSFTFVADHNSKTNNSNDDDDDDNDVEDGHMLAMMTASSLKTNANEKKQREIRNCCHGWCLKSIWNWKFIFHRTKTNKQSRMHAWIYSLHRVYYTH